MKTKLISIALLMALLLGLGITAMAEAWDTTKNVYQEGDVVATEEETEKGNPVFVIMLANGGVIRGELYPDVAPQAVGNFIALANSGYYDGLIFHRVIPGFMVQGGDIQGDGTGGPGWVIKGEFAQNGVANDIVHTRGVLSMARRNQPMDSAGSQFFIVVADSAHLDGAYAGFGRVNEGMEYVDEIVAAPRNATTNKPDEDQIMQSIRVETFGKEYPYDKL